MIRSSRLASLALLLALASPAAAQAFGLPLQTVPDYADGYHGIDVCLNNGLGKTWHVYVNGVLRQSGTIDPASQGFEICLNLPLKKGDVVWIYGDCTENCSAGTVSFIP